MSENNPCQMKYNKWYLKNRPDFSDETERFKHYLGACVEGLDEDSKTMKAVEGIVKVHVPQIEIEEM